MKLNGLKENKDTNPLCNLFCKLPKVTSASAISPERQTHGCHNQSVYEIVQKENLEKKLLLPAMNNTNAIPRTNINNQLKSITSYTSPISSYPNTSKELLSDVANSIAQANTQCASAISENK